MGKVGSLVRLMAAGLLVLFGAGAVNAEDRMLSPDDVIMVSDTSFDSQDPYDIVQSNITVINALYGGYLQTQEISRAALTSYYVDYYLAQVNNGGFGQFVFNSGWNGAMVELVREGLRDMGAPQHLALFEEGVASVEAMGKDKLQAYLVSDYFTDNPVRDSLHATDDRFFKLSDGEDLVKLNAAWLKRQPNLRVLSQEELQRQVERRSAALPDRAARVQTALDAEPRYTKLIRALCAKAGQTLQQVTAGDPTLVYDGKAIRRLSSEELDKRAGGETQLVWFFITDKGVYLMAEAGGKAAMFDNETKSKIAEIATP